MNSENRLLVFLAVLISGALFFALFTQIKVWNSRKRSLRKVDAFAEPLEEKFNEIVDNITVKFDEVKEAVTGFFEQKKIRSIEINRNKKSESN
jgi:hypothetical protein